MLRYIKYTFFLLIPLCLPHTMLLTNPGKPIRDARINPQKPPPDFRNQSEALTELLKTMPQDLANLSQELASTRHTITNTLAPYYLATNCCLPVVGACNTVKNWVQNKKWSDNIFQSANVLSLICFLPALYNYYQSSPEKE